MSMKTSAGAPPRQTGVAPQPRRLPLWMLYGWALLGASYFVLIWKGPEWFSTWSAEYGEALDALVAIAALTIGLLGFHRQGALRSWVLALWFATLLGGLLYVGLR